MKNKLTSVLSYLKPLLWPCILTLIFAIFFYFMRPTFVKLGSDLMEKTSVIIAYIIGIAFWLSVAWFICRLIDVMILELVLERRLKHRLPRLIKEILHVIIFFAAILVIFSVLFEQSVTGLLAASGAAGLLIGLAIQNLISDMFDGIAMSIDRPFEIGDSIYIHDRNVPVHATVKETGWRCTQFHTGTNELLIIPNSFLSNVAITNFSRANLSQTTYKIKLDATIPIKRILRILETAVRSTPGVQEFPAPKIYLSGIEMGGIIYSISYWLNTKTTPGSRVKHALSQRIMDLLQLAEIDLFVAKQICFDMESNVEAEVFVPDSRYFVSNIDLFQDLTAAEIEELCKHAVTHSASAGQEIVTIDKSGDSMFIVKEGLLQVFIKIADEDELVPVAYLVTGQFFGEMSLLTGAPRSATVIAKTNTVLIEISKEGISQQLQDNDHLLVSISRVIAERQFSNISKANELKSEKEADNEKQSLADNILGKIKSFFNIHGSNP